MKTLGDFTRQQRVDRPEAVALMMGAVRISYADLDRRANQIANALIADGCSPGTHIALLAKNNLEYFEVLFGANKSRTVMVPVNFRLAPPEIAYVINDAEAELLIVDEAHADAIAQIESELTTVRRILYLDGQRAGWDDFTAWRDAATDTEPASREGEDDVAMQMYTSGTTGHPKGAQLTNRNLIQSLTGTFEWTEWTADEVNLVCMPLFHISGAGWALLGIYHGAANVILADVVPAEILRLIPAEGITKVLFVPAIILFLLQAPECEATDFSSLNEVVYGASPIPLDLLQRALAVFECDFCQSYGLTETSGGITYLPAEDHHVDAGERMKSCGKPSAGVDIKIVDDKGGELTTGAVGEVIIRSAQVMKGYWNLPEASRQAIRGEWFHTGDAGYVDADGYLYIIDRIKDMVVSGGENIYPAEVESVIFQHPDVADVGVIGVPDEKWGEAVKAMVVRKSGAQVSEEDLIAYARTQIAGYKVPKSVNFVDDLPRNPSGKILKRELRRPFWEGRERQV